MGAVIEVTEAPLPAAPAEDENAMEPAAQEDGSEIVDVPVDQKLSIGSRRIIKVPCNGNAKPDRSGNCRSVW